MSAATSDQHAIIAGMIRRQLVLGLLLAVMLVGIGLRLFQMQVLEQEAFTRQAQRNRLEEVVQDAPRGDIVDRNGVVLASSVPRYDVTFYVPDTPPADWGWIPELASVLRLNPEESTEWQAAIESAKAFSRVPLVQDVPLARLMELAERQQEFPGVGISTGTKRTYPYAAITGHVLGYLGRISPEELERLKPMGYRGADLIGKGGLEQQYDAHLRGVPGYQYLEVDHRGRVQGRLTEPILLDPQTGTSIPAMAAPKQGPILRSTLDIELQEGIAKLFTGYEGSVVAMDVHTGEVLAAVSNPSYDPNLFGPGSTNRDVSALFGDDGNPVLNRFMGGYFIPGSVWKIVTALAGLEERVITEHTVLHCDGVYHTNTKDFRCHLLRGHGPETVRKALADSCDDYFYQVGVKLDVDRMAKWARMYGFGELTGVDLPQETAGLVGDREWKQRRHHTKWFLGDTIPYSIGQGYVLITTLQLARAYAYLANDGDLVVPHFNADLTPAPVTPTLIPDPKHLEIVRQGLRRVVDGGTGRIVNFSDMEIAGKTGTADDDSRDRPHSWFVSYAPYENPRVVLVVLAEAAGHGSHAAVPIARQIYQLPAMHRLLGLADPAAEPKTPATTLAQAR